jgi:hypothetical protein
VSVELDQRSYRRVSITDLAYIGASAVKRSIGRTEAKEPRNHDSESESP